MYAYTRQLNAKADIKYFYKGKFNLLNIGDILLDRYEIRDINAYEMTIEVEFLKKNRKGELVRSGERFPIKF